MEVNPHAIHLDDDEYSAKRPLRGSPPPPRSVVPIDSSSNLAANPHEISLSSMNSNNNDYDNGYPDKNNNKNGGGGGDRDEYGQTKLGPRDKSKEGKMTKKVCTAKALMCAFAIGFLWLTTFGIARGFVDIIIEADVTPEDVVSGWNQTFYDAQRVKANFESCVGTKNTQCLGELNASTWNERERGREIFEENEILISKAQDKLVQCQAKVQEKHEAIRIWMAQLNIVGKQLVTTQQCRNNSLYGQFLRIGDGNATQNADAQARSLTKQYQQALKDLSDQTRNAFAVRVAYNEQWASNHTAGLIDALSLNATKINVPNFTLNEAFNFLTDADLAGLQGVKDTLGPRMNDTWNQFVTQYANAKAQAQIMRNTTLEYRASFQAAYVNMSSYYSQSRQWLADAKATLAEFGTPCGFNAPTIDINEPNFPGLPNLPDLNMNGFNLTTTQFDNNLKNKLAGYKAASQAKADAANAEVKAYFESLDIKPDWYSCIACDYNPPPLLFPSSEEQEENDDNFNNQLNGLLQNLGDAADNAQIISDKHSNDTFELPSLEFIQAQRSKADLQYATLGGDVDFANILAAFATISSLLFNMDYVYRAFRSVSLIVRYWFGSAVGLPDIDIKKQKSAEVSEPIGVRIMTFLTSPAFVLVIVGVIVFGIVWVLMDVYVPIVTEYADGCASPEKENGPGTMISRNAYSLVYNNAVGSGQKDMQTHLNDYDTLRQSICGQYVSQTSTTQSQVQSLLTAVLQAYQRTYEDLQVMSQCMNVTTNGINFFVERNGSTPGTGYNFIDATGKVIPFEMNIGPQQAYDENAISCTQHELLPFSVLEDMTFVCQNVSLCTRMGECVQAIDTPVLKRGSWKSSCDSEKIVLVGITAAGFSIFVYVMWNLGRIFIVMGLGRLLWRHLVPHGFNYVATCSTDGRIARDTEKEVTSKLNKVISTFERWGIIYLCFALFLQLVWIIPMAVFASEIASVST